MEEARRLQLGRAVRVMGVVAAFAFVAVLSYGIGTISGKISTLQREANRVYPVTLTKVYERVMRDDVEGLLGMPMVSDEAAADFAEIEKEFGPVEAFQLDYVESQFLGEHHTFSVQVKRRGVWGDEVMVAKRLHGLTLVSRADGPGKLSDSIVSPKSRKFPLHEKGKG